MAPVEPAIGAPLVFDAAGAPLFLKRILFILDFSTRGRFWILDCRIARAKGMRELLLEEIEQIGLRLTHASRLPPRGSLSALHQADDLAVDDLFAEILGA